MNKVHKLYCVLTFSTEFRDSVIGLALSGCIFMYSEQKHSVSDMLLIIVSEFLIC